MIKGILTLMGKLMIMLLAGKTEAGSVEVQPARDSRLKATNCRWGGSLLPSHFINFADNSELCNALKNLIKQPRQRREKSQNCEKDLSNSR